MKVSFQYFKVPCWFVVPPCLTADGQEEYSPLMAALLHVPNLSHQDSHFPTLALTWLMLRGISSRLISTPPWRLMKCVIAYLPRGKVYLDPLPILSWVILLSLAPYYSSFYSQYSNLWLNIVHKTFSPLCGSFSFYDNILSSDDFL